GEVELGEGAIVLVSHLVIGTSRILWGIEDANIFLRAVQIDLRPPLPGRFNPHNSDVARCIVPQHPPVESVLPGGDEPEVAPLVVEAIAILVIHDVAAPGA